MTFIRANRVSTHSHPKVAALVKQPIVNAKLTFQHTATRRWLLTTICLTRGACVVSTHSHPKVAAQAKAQVDGVQNVSTHSHPKVAANVLPVYLMT